MREGHDWKLTTIPDWPVPPGYASMKTGHLGWKCEKCQHWAPPQFTYSNPPADEVLVDSRSASAMTCEEAILLHVMEQ